MSRRLAQVTGTVTTVGAGVLLAGLSMSAFGAIPTLLVFSALLLAASATARAMARRR